MANHWFLLIFFVLSIYFAANIHTCLCAPNISAVCSKQERLALLKFKHSVNDVADMLSSWVGNDCCQWERVHCDNVTGKVDSLHLRGREDYINRDDEYLIGKEVITSLGDLRHLKFLDLSANDFRGSRIPEFIGSFKHLSYLNLSNAYFSGFIPPHIGNLSNLVVLDLKSRHNTIMMSDDMSWISGLSLLKYLDLSHVDLSKAQNRDMVFYMMPSLVELSLSACGLTNADLGTLSNSSTTIANIKHLDLGYNHFKGQFPGFFRNMTSLEFLDLSKFNFSLSRNSTNFLSMIHYFPQMRLSSCGLNNMHLSPNHLNATTISIIQHLDLSQNLIKGRFPSVLINMSSLLSLNLANNMLNSSVPIMPNLLRLDLSYNKFEHTEDVGIWRQCHLKELTVSYNDFGIEMTDSPKNVSECSQYAFERLDLHRSFKGKLPESLGRLRLLEELDLSENQLTGRIPTFIGKLTKLVLSGNHLNGSIPESIKRLVSLQVFSVYSNSLNGTVPVSIGQLTKLRDLHISENSLEGVISEAHFAKLSMLKYLDTAYNNKLTFNVSREWKPPFQLISASLNSNKIINGFPQWLRTQKKLRSLRLSNASITGPVPTWLRKMPVVNFLDLSHNKLSGPIRNLPNEGSVDVSEESALFLQDNLFNESIPISLCRRIDLEYLDLSRNRLTGRIPECLGNLRNLNIMQFSSNQLSGVISSSMVPQSSMLSWLNLNDNYFTGELPRELENLRELSVLNLGDNGFSGNIPEWIGENLTNLIVFRLHNNNFTGSIPPSLCNNSVLQVLDVAHNNLTGPIPHCLGKLKGMITGSSGITTLLEFSPEEYLIQVMKGVSLEYTTTFQLVINMDLSSNKLIGEIPVELMSLFALVGLNLSNNHLIGSIPNSIGNMKALSSLDFSGNQLTGPIPPSIGALSFLSHLNLSHNNLSGQIPTGNQLQTLTDPSIYVGNRDLCGAPLPKNCSNNEDQTTVHKNSKAANHKSNKLWFYMDIMGGFAAGFWGFIGVLLFKKHWRHKLYRFSEKIMDKIYVAVVVRVHKMKRGRESA
ncbi:leucine-rich repeat protein [Tanacetum coccineum]